MPVRLLAALVLALEAVGVAALAAWQVVAITAGDTVSLSSALALVVLTLVGAVAVAGFAVATARGRSWGRSGGIVVQVLMIAVAVTSLTGGAAPLVALAIAAPAVVGFVLLVLAARAAAPGRDSGPDA